MGWSVTLLVFGIMHNHWTSDVTDANITQKNDAASPSIGATEGQMSQRQEPQYGAQPQPQPQYGAQPGYPPQQQQQPQAMYSPYATDTGTPSSHNPVLHV